MKHCRDAVVTGLIGDAAQDDHGDAAATPAEDDLAERVTEALGLRTCVSASSSGLADDDAETLGRGRGGGPGQERRTAHRRSPLGATGSEPTSPTIGEPEPGVVVWLNGPFGVGKSTTAERLVKRVPGALLCDPEKVGTMVRNLLPGRAGDWQDIEVWRPLVADTIHRLLGAYGGPLIVPMTLLREDYAEEIFGLLDGFGSTVHHLALTCEPTVLHARIDGHNSFPGDPVRSAKVRLWRQEKAEAYRAALPWLQRRARLVDTTSRSPVEVADEVLAIIT